MEKLVNTQLSLNTLVMSYDHQDTYSWLMKHLRLRPATQVLTYVWYDRSIIIALWIKIYRINICVLQYSVDLVVFTYVKISVCRCQVVIHNGNGWKMLAWRGLWSCGMLIQHSVYLGCQLTQCLVSTTCVLCVLEFLLKMVKSYILHLVKYCLW